MKRQRSANPQIQINKVMAELKEFLDKITPDVNKKSSKQGYKALKSPLYRSGSSPGNTPHFKFFNNVQTSQSSPYRYDHRMIGNVRSIRGKSIRL